MTDVKLAVKMAEKLISTKNEKDVENVYRAEFLSQIPGASITSPYGTDGVLKAESLYVLLEFKHELDFQVRPELIKPLIQGMVYLKKFYDNETSIPTALFVGDRNECFMVPTESLHKYLKRVDVDWSGAPSSAWKELPDLYRELVKDRSITPHVLNVQSRDFLFKHVIENLQAMHVGQVIKIPITVQNITGVFRSWEERVLKEKLDTQQSVAAFIASVRGEATLVPRRSQIIYGTTRVGVDPAQHEAFFSWFGETYDGAEQRALTAVQDRLLDEEVRRRSGDFYTPTLWADEAHKMLDEQLGSDWRDEYVVWDCAAGTGNLTRDYSFKELYLSTLYEEDVQTIQDMHYNPGAEIFQFDFLNDVLRGDGIHGDIEASARNIPAKLEESLKAGKKFVFLINPPFGATGNAGLDTEKRNKEIGDTQVRSSMDLGHPKRQLYAQFMYRITEIVRRFGLKDSVFALYSVPLFMSGPSYKKFREYFYQNWKFNRGFLFKADEFNGTSSQWGCSFTIWKEGTDTQASKDLTIKYRNKHGQIQDFEDKPFYSPEHPADVWCRAPTSLWRGKDTKEPLLTSAVKVKTEGGRGTTAPNMLGYMHCDSNNIMQSAQLTGIYSTGFSVGQGIHIFPCNYLRAVALFTARKAVGSNWINQKDEYCAPDEMLPGYAQWNADCIVFSLFQASSQQSSLRRIEYKGEKWDIQNEFFWMARAEMQGMARAEGFHAMDNDAIKFNQDRYVYNELKKHRLSSEAQEILDMACDLTRKAMSMREIAHNATPEYHLDAWDAGWYQIRKGILEVYFQDEYKKFTEKFLVFRDFLKEGVFDFGFLKEGR